MLLAIFPNLEAYGFELFSTGCPNELKITTGRRSPTQIEIQSVHSDIAIQGIQFSKFIMNLEGKYHHMRDLEHQQLIIEHDQFII